jgi:hypothetical protein
MKQMLAFLAVVLLCCQPAFSNLLPSMGVDAYVQAPKIRTYSASSNTFTPYATPSDICVLGGIATKVIKVYHVRVFGTQTSAGVNGFFIIKRSTYNTGSQNSLTAVPHDSQTIAAGADIAQFTAAPTSLGTLVGVVRGADVFTPAPASTTSGGWYDFDFGPNTGVQPILLRANQMLAVNFGGAAVPSGLVMSCEFSWTEE